MRQKIFWAACSLALVGCGIGRPDADLCILNAPGAKLTCYNLKEDYDKKGNLKPGVEPHFVSAPNIEAINKHVVMSPQHFARLKAYIKTLREEYESCE